jgi:hypothetical protein
LGVTRSVVGPTDRVESATESSFCVSYFPRVVLPANYDTSPERAPLARVVLASGTFNYDPRDDADVVRIARLIADEPEVASVNHDDLRTALASVRNGSTFTS